MASPFLIQILFLMLMIISSVTSSNADAYLEIRGEVASDDFAWNGDNFAGFYYDIDDNISTEMLWTNVTNNRLLEPNGIVYASKAAKDDFKFEDWGSYSVIGFLSERYFAAYLDSPDSSNPFFFLESEDRNALEDEQLLKILVDSDAEMNASSGTILVLEEGYELSIQSIDIDGEKVYLELSRDGRVLDSSIVCPCKENASAADKTYCYSRDVGRSKDLVVIAVSFKNAFRSLDQDLVTINGIWQLSDNPLLLAENSEYGKMTVQNVSGTLIVMNNEDNSITLSQDSVFSIMPGISIKTAESENLRYYIFKPITSPGAYEIRSNVADDTFVWTANKFDGFYFDINHNISTETLIATVTDSRLKSPDGVVYRTAAREDQFEFPDWGSYGLVGFLGERYFAEYVPGRGSKSPLFNKSGDRNILSDQKLLKILINDDTERVVDCGSSISLEEDYELVVDSIDIEGKKVCIELWHNGSLKDRKIISPYQTDSDSDDETYCFKKDTGNCKDLVIIAAHLKSIFSGSGDDLATIDGLWQLSQTAEDVSQNTKFENMTVREASVDSIILSNKDKDFSLGKNKEIYLLPGISIKTADATELRYYLSKKVTVDG